MLFSGSVVYTRFLEYALRHPPAPRGLPGSTVAAVAVSSAVLVTLLLVLVLILKRRKARSAAQRTKGAKSAASGEAAYPSVAGQDARA